jgi:hypothetical protein
MGCDTALLGEWLLVFSKRVHEEIVCLWTLNTCKQWQHIEMCGTMQHHIPDDQTFQITVSLHHIKLFELTEFLLAYLTILLQSADPVALLMW